MGFTLPAWYTKEESHQAEFAGIAEQMDELHQRGHTEYEDRMLHHILDCRYDRQRQTILISNEDPERFCESIGSAVVDRMEESGVLLKCDWHSFRDRK